MRRRALIRAVLLVAPLALLGGSRRTVFLLRPSPGLRRRVRFSAPNPPPRVQGGGYFLACRAGVAFSLRPFLVSAPSRRPPRLGLAAAAPSARSPSAGALVQPSSFVARAPWFFLLTSPVRERSYGKAGEPWPHRGPVSALLPAEHLPRWVRTPMSADSDRKGLRAGEDARRSSPGANRRASPITAIARRDPSRQHSSRADFPVFSHVKPAGKADRIINVYPTP